MSIEKIPPKFEAKFDPFSDVDHAAATLYAQARILNADHTIRENLAEAFGSFRAGKSELIDRLITRGIYLEPIDDEMNCLDPDYTRLCVFNSASAMALICIDSLAYEMGVPRNKWQQVWASLPEHVDGPSRFMQNDQPLTSESCRLVGETMVHSGHRVCQIIEPPYQSLLEAVEERFEQIQDFRELFHGSFGFVFGVGRVVLESMTLEDRVEAGALRVLPNPDGLDEGLRQAVRWDRKIARSLRRSSQA